MRHAALPLIALMFTLACTRQPTSVAAAKPLGPTEKWEFRTSKAVPMAHYAVSESSPALADDGAIYVGGDRGLFAINRDGSEKWLYEPPGPVAVSPVIGDDGTIWISSLAQLQRVDPDGNGRGLVGFDIAKQVGIGFAEPFIWGPTKACSNTAILTEAIACGSKANISPLPPTDAFTPPTVRDH